MERWNISAWRQVGKGPDGKRHSFPCPWVIEGDIKGCFDHIDHHQVMERIRRRCA